MKKLFLFYCLAALGLLNKANAQNVDGQSTPIDSSIMYVNGEGTFLRLGKTQDTKLNLITTIQTGFQFNQLDSTNGLTNTNRMSLNMVRMSFTASTLKDKVTMGIVTDFTSVTPILEGWVGFSVWKKHGKIILGQRQTNTNNRLAMADERYAQVMGQTFAGKSNDGIVYGGLMQNFVGSTREGGLFFETNFKFKNWKIYPSVSITTGEGQNFFASQPNLGFKYGGRIDVLPFGDFIKNNAFIAHDIYREHKPKLAVGFAASYNVKASSAIGTDNAQITGIYNKSGVADYANYTKVVADFIFKQNGFALVGEYVNGSISGTDLFTNVSNTNKLTPVLASAYYNLGSAFNIQSSYVFNNGWAVDGRYESVMPEFDVVNSNIRTQQWYTFGVNKFMKNNAAKIGLNINYMENVTPLITTKKIAANLAVQILL